VRQKLGKKKIRYYRRILGLENIESGTVRGGTDHRVDLYLDNGISISYWPDGSLNYDFDNYDNPEVPATIAGQIKALEGTKGATLADAIFFQCVWPLVVEMKKQKIEDLIIAETITRIAIDEASVNAYIANIKNYHKRKPFQYEVSPREAQFYDNLPDTIRKLEGNKKSNPVYRVKRAKPVNEKMTQEADAKGDIKEIPD
jgi:hypothetical protein